MEIGSEFWIDSTKSYSIDNENPDWLKKFGYNIQLVSTGRGALDIILKQLKSSKRIKIALLPFYICSSVIIPFEQNNYIIKYYDLNRDLSPRNLEEIKWDQIDVFLHLGYFGFSTNDSVHNLKLKLTSNSVTVIEDVTHSMFSSYNNKNINDFVFGSIRKWFGVPGGAFLASDKRPRKIELSSSTFFLETRKQNLLLKDQYINSNDIDLKKIFLEGFNKAEELIDENISASVLDYLSLSIISNLKSDNLIQKRRENYDYLFAKINDLIDIVPVSQQITAGVTPLFFPIYSKKRDELRKVLTENEIYCPIHWPIPKQVSKSLTETTKQIYDSILSIPCDQRYDLKDMDRIVSTIMEFLN